MLFAGLAGFFNADAENMKAKAQARRAAEAELLKDKRGFKKQLILNSIESNMSNVSDLREKAAKGDITLSDAFRQSVQDRSKYDADYEFGTPYNPPELNYSAIDFVNSNFNTIIKDSSGNKIRYTTALIDDKGKGANASTINMFYKEIGDKVESAGFDKQTGEPLFFKNMSDEMLNKHVNEVKSTLPLLVNQLKKGVDEFEVPIFFPKTEGKSYYQLTQMMNEAERRKIDTKENVLSVINKNLKNKKLNKNSLVEVVESDDTAEVLDLDLDDEDMANVDLVSSTLNIPKENIMGKLYSKFVKIPGQKYKPSYMKDMIQNAAILVQKIPNIKRLSRGRTTLGGDDNIVQMNKDINSIDGDFVDKVLALAPFLKVKKPQIKSKFTTAQQMFLQDKTPADLATESEKAYAGGYFLSFDPAIEIKDRIEAFDKAQEQNDKNKLVLVDLKKFYDARGNLKTQTELAAKFKSAFISGVAFLGDFTGGVKIGNTAAEIESGDDSANNNKQLTRGYLDKLQEEATRLSIGEDGKINVQLAELQAMRISLAFMMARAADPSGRLSNQDIEQQFVKLGTGFQTKEAAEAGIKQAIKEFTYKTKQYGDIFKFVSDGTMDTEEKYKLIDAAFTVQEISNKAFLIENSPRWNKQDKQQQQSYKGLNIDINEIIYDRQGKPMKRFKDNGSGIIDDRKEMLELYYKVEEKI